MLKLIKFKKNKKNNRIIQKIFKTIQVTQI